MLGELTSTKKEIEAALSRMPLSMKTMSLQKKQEDLEAKLRQVEKNIETFSKKKVYVAF